MYCLHNLRVILIGGTSHAGKSTLAQALASELGGRYLSTDTLARHPGRPWQAPPKTVPDHVAQHYLSLSVDELLADVERHYTQNVWPLVEPLIAASAFASANDHLVIEGSALLPELVATITDDRVGMVWLTASPPFLKARMYRESDYPNKTPRERKMIDTFLERTLRFNERTIDTANRLGLTLLNGDNRPPHELFTVCLAELQKQEGERFAGGEN